MSIGNNRGRLKCIIKFRAVEPTKFLEIDLSWTKVLFILRLEACQRKELVLTSIMWILTCSLLQYILSFIHFAVVSK